jgi:TolB-like protein/tetratricopeptide (TPR) repeat protein
MRPVIARFVLEARRRGLLRIATAYLIVTWLVLEIGHTLFLVFDLPHGALQFIFVLLALGFPVVLLGVWQGWFGASAPQNEVSPGEAHANAHHEGPWLAAVFGAVALFAVAVAIGVRFFGMGGSGSSHVASLPAAPHADTTTPAAADAVTPPAFNPPAHSIAVLPFVNMSGAPENDHFSDGLSDELINVLSGIHGLKVAGRTSSFYFKGRLEQPEVIGRTLKVAHFLEGSVRKVGPQLRITAQLVEADSGYQLWSDVYDREIGDVLVIQEDIARSVASALRVQLLPADEARVEEHRKHDPEAHRLYLVARGKIRERGLANLRAARTLLEEAIRRDPDYAEAYASLADSHFLLVANHFEGDWKDSERQGQNAVERALALNPSSSEALTARANFESLRYERHGEANAKLRAITDYRRAIELDPTNARAHHWYGKLILEDEPDRSLELFSKALELDPLERVFQLSLGQISMLRGRYAEARKHFQEVIDRYPDYDGAYRDAAFLEHAFGRLVAARALWQKSYELAPEWEKASNIHLTSSDLGDLETAKRWLPRITGSPVADLDREVTRLLVAKRGRETPALLEEAIDAGLDDMWIVLSAASWSLILDQPERAIARIKQRFPDAGAEDKLINLFNGDAAIVLAASWQRTGQHAAARRLLHRVAAWLNSPQAPRYPSMLVARAQVHALLGEKEEAVQVLNRAYDAGYRYTDACSVTLIAMDGEDNPLFGSLRGDPRLTAWFARIRADNARQFAELNRAAQAHSP